MYLFSGVTARQRRFEANVLLELGLWFTNQTPRPVVYELGV